MRDNDVGWEEMKVASEDDGPTVAEIIDDRPEELKKKQDGWKAVGGRKRESSPVRTVQNHFPLARKIFHIIYII